MQPIEILSYLNKTHTRLFRGRAGLTNHSLREVLKIGGDVARVSRSLNHPNRAVAPVIEALCKESIRRELELRLGMTGVFDCRNVAEIDALVQEALPPGDEPKRPPPNLLAIRTGVPIDPNELPRSDSEAAVLDGLSDLIERERCPIVHWPIERLSGANYLAVSVGSRLNTADYDWIIAIAPSDLSNPFEAEMQALRTWLYRQNAPIRGPSELVGALEKLRVLLVVRNAECLPARPLRQEANSLRNLVRALDVQEVDCRPRVVLSGATAVAFSCTKVATFRTEIESSHADTGKIRSNTLQVPPQRRFEFFYRQLKKCLVMRGGGVTLDHVDFRVKRARWHYEQSDSSELWPIEIRLRALFASNQSNYAYFDPTGGFSRLVGEFNGAIPQEVRFYEEEVELFLDRVSRNEDGRISKRKTDLQLLRWCSAALYWQTRDTLDILRRGAAGGLSKKMDDASLENSLQNLSGIVRVIDTPDHTGKPSSIYLVPLGIRAIVQDQWKAERSPDRAYAHFWIARRLFDNQNDKELLDWEFPVRPHWGRSRHYFLAECIRHLVRAVEASSGDNSRKSPAKANESGFPETPSQGSNGVDVSATITYCYEVLYNAQLNGNHTPNHRARSLTKRHGAYHLSAELLQLLSGDSEFPHPHTGMSDLARERYVSDVGFAKLDLGELDHAQICFEQALARADAEVDIGSYCRAHLNLALTLTLRGDTGSRKAAWEYIREADRALRAVSERYTTHRAKRTVEDLSKQIQSRKAHLYYLEGQIEAAVDIYEELPVKSLRRENGYYYILALLENGGLKSIDKATRVCLANVFENTSRGDQHEALVFRILLASILRNVGFADSAEQCLNSIYREIQEFGCSERAYINFLLEAGRTLAAQNRPARAYAVYLRRCLVRSEARKFASAAEDARNDAKAALAAVEELYVTTNPADAAQAIRDQLDGSGDFEMPRPTTTLHGLPFDPQASFDHIENQDWFRTFTDKSLFQAERASLE